MALKLLFKRVSVINILKGKINPENIEELNFIQLLRSYSDCYSDTELQNLYYYLVRNFSDNYHATETDVLYSNQFNVFQLLRYYAKWILCIQDNEIMCEYEKFLHWRTMTLELNEDLFTACYLADRESMDKEERLEFNWKVVLTHNNRELKKMLSNGLAENHAHLKGSAPIFQLNWISLMNDPIEVWSQNKLEEMEKKRRSFNVNYTSGIGELSLKDQVIIAAYIRKELFKYITEEIEDEEQVYFTYNEIILMQNEISDRIRILRQNYGTDILPDYAIAGVPTGRSENNMDTLIFQGERWLLYSMFLKIFMQDVSVSEYVGWFYAYLVLKENIRSELVQTNNSVGFENFKTYENRKDAFLESSFYRNQIVKKAVQSILFDGYVVTMEARIAPRKNYQELFDNIHKIDSLVIPKENENLKSRFFYVMHFIKQRDVLLRENPDIIQCRHYSLRKAYQKQAADLIQLRKKCPKTAARIRGIDAANTEIGCGSEVFSQVFRYLSNHSMKNMLLMNYEVPQLRMTYHVGEDFLDLASGLRAIDEAVKFLGLRCGDRLGHAIALGIDADEWYNGKKFRILLSQQEYLDNIVWLHHFMLAFEIPEYELTKGFLQKEYEYYFHVIYRNAMNNQELDEISNNARNYYKDTEWEGNYNVRDYHFSMEYYYRSWQLRGDNPYMYRDGFFANEYKNMTLVPHTFSAYAVNTNFPKRQNDRYIQEVGVLYYYYHFNANVRTEGDKPIEIKVKKEYIDCIKAVQKVMQTRIGKAGICIETNPSSNYLISTFKHYDKHPIIKLYNKDLVESDRMIQECPQLNVSINTDDAGIFSTSLENEYAYMALALEKKRDEKGNYVYKKQNVYRWLDNIRKMGIEQTFLSSSEMKVAYHEWMKEKEMETAEIYKEHWN